MSKTGTPPANTNGSAQSWIIGSARECEMVVPQAVVSHSHCRLTKTDEGFWIEDLVSTNGTFLDGNRIVPGKRFPIPPGALVTLGQHLPMPWPELPPPAAPTPEIITIGRSPASHVQVDLPIVSWDHARILAQGGRYLLEDLHSRNGTSIGVLANRIRQAPLDRNADVFLGSYKIPAHHLLSPRRVEIGDSVFHKVSFRGNSMVVGRDPSCDVPLDYPMVSWHHARFTRAPEGILVEDLGSRNGTFVRGVRISGKALARIEEEIGLGSFRFQIIEGGDLLQREYYGNVTIEAENIVVSARDGRRLIEPVSMTIFPSELVAVMGGAGAGKTTLLKALNGGTRPSEGRVLFNGASLYAFYDRFRQQMGYVPQDDIVHPQLTVGEALYFSARLRTDLSDSEIHARVQKVLADLRMEDKIDTLIGSPERKTLSGGQRKRVNIGLELINDTPVLFLDEPTSGLSSYDAESLVDILKQLSREGKTIVTTIHQPSLKIYKQFDDLVMVNRDQGGSTGSMVFFGPAYPDSIQFFDSVKSPGKSDAELSPDTLLSSLPNRTSAQWRELYTNSVYFRDFVSGRSGRQPANAGSEPAQSARRHFDSRQWFALVRRNTLVKLRDRTQSAILLLQAPVFALLIFLVYHPLSASAGYAALTPRLAGAHFLMVVAAIWFGCNNAARDIVGEWTIYRRERMITLQLASYVLSKLAVLLVLCVVQCLSLLLIVYFALGLKSGFGSDLLVLLVSALIGSGLGLCISAFSRTTESAIALLPLVLLPVIALGGGMRPIYQIDPRVRWVTAAVPSRWAFEANLLHETACDGWSPAPGEAALDDLPDTADPAQRQQLAVRSTQPASHALQALPPPMRSPSPCSLPSELHMNRILNGDVAELAIPRFILTLHNHGERSTVRAFQGETATGASVAFRNSFGRSLFVLLSMLVTLVLAVLAILRRRDNQPE